MEVSKGEGRMGFEQSAVGKDVPAKGRGAGLKVPSDPQYSINKLSLLKC